MGSDLRVLYVPSNGVEPSPPALQAGAHHHESFPGIKTGVVSPAALLSIHLSYNRRGDLRS